MARMITNMTFRAWRISQLVLAATLLCAAFAGCAPRAHFMVWHPAEIDIVGLERLAIIDFEGEQQSGKIARSALQNQLFENKYYQLVDQAELARVRPVLRPDGSPDMTAALEAARMLNVDVLLCGQVVSYNVADDLQTDHHVEIGGGSSESKAGKSSALGFGLDSTQTLTREASVSLAVKLIDVRTGQLKGARQFAHTFNGKRVNGTGELPGREAILTKLLSECAQDTEKMIAPHYRQQEVALARIYYGKGLTEIREGNKLAARGKWQEAEQQWQAAAKENPQSHAAHYNLAVVAEVRQDYAAAKEHLDKALKQYAAVDYQKYKTKLEADQRKYNAAMAQAQSRPTMIAARFPHSPPPQQQFVQHQPMQPGPPPQIVPQQFAQAPPGQQPPGPPQQMPPQQMQGPAYYPQQQPVMPVGHMSQQAGQ